MNDSSMQLTVCIGDKFSHSLTQVGIGVQLTLNNVL